MRKSIMIFSISLMLLGTHINLLAKQVEIGIGAIAIDASVIGKGKFLANDTIDEGNSLKTGDKGSTTILFNDESMLTLGPKAHASIEVYKETQDGKPGRSIIRVHEGQFRYFPGAILENGGSQFIAVGNKLLGKGTVTASVVTNNSTHQSTPSSSSNKNENANNSGNENANNSGNSNANNSENDNNQNTTENDAPADVSDETIISEVEEPQEKGNENNNADSDNGNNDNPGTKPDLKPEQFEIAETGKIGTGESGGIPGSQQKKHKIEFDQLQFGGQGQDNSVIAGDNVIVTPPSSPATQPRDQLLARMADNSLIVSNDGSSSTGINGLTTSTGGLGSEAFAENGISGNVVDGLGNFHGAADVFSRTNVGVRTDVGFIGTIKVGRSIALNTNARNGLSELNKTARLPQAGSTPVLPTGDLTNTFNREPPPYSNRTSCS